MEFIEIEGQKSEPVIGRPCGQLVKASTLLFKKKKDAAIRIQGGSSSGNSRLFERGFNFQAMGIGGLDKEFADIFRRAFASRVFPPEVLRKMGIKHVRGMLLYGPPGCGKTLIARQIGKALNAHEPKVVNGPEILNKYVGESEANIRALFEDAEKEQEEMGDNSDLHIIIFDEIDAICKSRGANGDGSAVGSQGLMGRHRRARQHRQPAAVEDRWSRGAEQRPDYRNDQPKRPHRFGAAASRPIGSARGDWTAVARGPRADSVDPHEHDAQQRVSRRRRGSERAGGADEELHGRRAGGSGEERVVLRVGARSGHQQPHQGGHRPREDARDLAGLPARAAGGAAGVRSGEGRAVDPLPQRNHRVFRGVQEALRGADDDGGAGAELRPDDAHVGYRMAAQLLNNTFSPCRDVVLVFSGPSLNESFERLLALKEEGARIIACDSALPFLERQNFAPDIVVTADVGMYMIAGEDCELGKPQCFIKRDLYEHSALIFTAKTHLRLVALFSGKRYLLYTSDLGQRNVVKQEHALTDLDLSSGSASIMLSLAFKQQAWSIYFMGLDTVAQQSTFHAGLSSELDQAITGTAQTDPVECNDGKMRKALHSYTASRLYVESVIAKHPQVEFINCSSFGAVIKGCSQDFFKRSVELDDVDE